MKPDEITVTEVVEMARAQRLRLRAFGETVIFGQQLAFGGDPEHALATLSDCLTHGIFRVYRDREGIFVGPADPAYVDGGAHGV